MSVAVQLPVSSTRISQPQPRPIQHRAQNPWEFTKRKKWSDLLLNELAGTIMFVLSSRVEILYCGAAAVELLGWREDELVDTALSNWMHEDDVAAFVSHFESCVSEGQELSTYARLRGRSTATDARYPLFEFRGHPHFDPATREFKCFFAMARPYPSRNSAMLDSFLELKIENERLRARLMELRPSNSPPPHPSATSLRSTYDPLEGPSSYPPSPVQRPFYPASTAARPSIGSLPILDDEPRFTSLPEQDTLAYAPTARVRTRDEAFDKEDAARKKKLRKIANGQAAQYVCRTCGRTDSPEWRKGPMGAKTLCNACGLRWAKKNQKRKTDEGSTDGQAA